MERVTKILVIVWACAAVAWQLTRLHSWPQLPPIAAAVALVSMGLALWDRRSVALVLSTAYIFPVYVRFAQGFQYPPFVVLWMAALLAAMLPDALRTTWHIPTRWRGALIFAALVVIVATPIIIWREIDGAWLLASDPAAMHWIGEVPPPYIVTWAIHVALVLVIGILWFDWLFGVPGLEFEQVVVTALVVGATATAAVSFYQMFVDIGWLNQTAFATMERATGTMNDANVAGMVGALWTGGTFLWAVRLRGWRTYAAPPIIALNWIAVWGSGSRGALVAAVTITAAAGLTMAVTGRRMPLRRMMTFAAVVLIVGLATGFAAASAGTVSPAGRLWASLPFSNVPSIGRFAAELWSRNGYGTAADQMIQEFPVGGVGISTFYGFVPHYGNRMGLVLPPDNAQNWLRHQVAEFGLVGALGWIVWFFSFAAFVFIWHKGEPPATWTARGMLIAFGVVSLMGMSGQDLIVAITFWTIAFWYVSLAGTPPAGRPLSAWTWIGMGVALIIFAVGSTTTAAHGLRLSDRALRLNMPFSYGFAPPETSGDNAGFRITQARAAALVDVVPHYMAITVRLADGDAGTRPIEVRIWKNGEAVLKAQLANSTPVTGFVPIEAAGRVLLEASAREMSASRFWRSNEDVGLLVKWEFVDRPPPRFQGYQAQPSTGS